MIKVCGMRNAENIRAVEALGIDLMGFIFWTKSSRYVSERPAYLPTKCKRVGVFVDEDIETVKRIADEYALDYIQLHGHESPDYIRALRVVDGFPVDIHLIKAISVSGRDDIATYKSYEGLVDYFLFDTKCPSVGGSGQQFDWSVLSAYDGNTPFLLSGGIGPDDAPRLRALSVLDGFPVEKCAGIDLNSRFELAPGLKDVTALQKFLNEFINCK
jgi:phosphoribosylanthranilate isomerase